MYCKYSAAAISRRSGMYCKYSVAAISRHSVCIANTVRPLYVGVRYVLQIQCGRYK